MICENCGKEISDAAVICPLCKVYTKNATANIKEKMPDDIKLINEIPELKKRFKSSTDTNEMREIIQAFENMRNEALTETITDYKYKLLVVYAEKFEKAQFNSSLYQYVIGLRKEIGNYKDAIKIFENLEQKRIQEKRDTKFQLGMGIIIFIILVIICIVGGKILR